MPPSRFRACIAPRSSRLMLTICRKPASPPYRTNTTVTRSIRRCALAFLPITVIRGGDLGPGGSPKRHACSCSEFFFVVDSSTGDLAHSPSATRGQLKVTRHSEDWFCAVRQFDEPGAIAYRG